MAVSIVEPPDHGSYAATVTTTTQSLADMSVTLTAGLRNPQIEIVVPSGGNDVAVQFSGANAVYADIAKIPAGATRKFIESATRPFSGYEFISDDASVIIGIFEMGFIKATGG